MSKCCAEATCRSKITGEPRRQGDAPDWIDILGKIAFVGRAIDETYSIRRHFPIPDRNR